MKSYILFSLPDQYVSLSVFAVYKQSGGSYSSGVLVGGEHFEYQKTSPKVLQKVAKIKQLAERFHVNVKAAARWQRRCQTNT